MMALFFLYECIIFDKDDIFSVMKTTSSPTLATTKKLNLQYYVYLKSNKRLAFTALFVRVTKTALSTNVIRTY